MSRDVESISFHDLTPADAAEARSLVLAGLSEHWGVIDPALNADLDDLGAAYPNGRTIVARDALGMCATGTCVPRDGTTAELVRMSVRIDVRRSGFGRAVVEELVATAGRWGMARVTLETSTRWHDAIAFYRRCGFEITHEISGEFGSDTWFARQIR